MPVAKDLTDYLPITILNISRGKHLEEADLVKPAGRSAACSHLRFPFKSEPLSFGDERLEHDGRDLELVKDVIY